MKLNVETFTTLEVKLPRRYRIVPIDALDLGFSETDGKQLSSEILTSKKYKYPLKLNDYAPYKYKKVVFRSTKEIKFRGTKETTVEFKNKLKEILIADCKDAFQYTSEILDEQVDVLLLALATYDVNKIKRHYRKDARKNAIEFYHQMAKFIAAKNYKYDSSGIKIAFGKIKRSDFKLPAPMGNNHLISALIDFFMDYYTQNQPTKNLGGMTEDLVVANNGKIKSGAVKLDPKLIEDFHYSFHVTVLNKLRTFPQFPESQRKAEFNLTDSQGRFLAAFLYLLNYDHWKKNSYKYISPQFSVLQKSFLNGQARSIKYRMKAYLSSYKNAGDYTI